MSNNSDSIDDIQKEKDRLLFFRNCCKNLIIQFDEISLLNKKSPPSPKNASNFLDSILNRLKSKELINKIEFEVDKNAARLINDNYWFLLDNIAKKIIRAGKDEKSKESSVDLYKILSITEFAVITTQPIILVYNGDENIENGSKLFKQLITIERLVNGYFAWACAFSLLSEWKSLNDLTSGDNPKKNKKVREIWHKVLTHIEDIDERKTSLTILVEHIRIIANTTGVNLPIWTNAMWWRLLLLHINDRVNDEAKEVKQK